MSRANEGLWQIKGALVYNDNIMFIITVRLFVVFLFFVSFSNFIVQARSIAICV